MWVGVSAGIADTENDKSAQIADYTFNNIKATKV